MEPCWSVSLLIFSGLGVIAALGYLDRSYKVLLRFLQRLAAILTVILAVITKGKYYTKYEADDVIKEDYIA